MHLLAASSIVLVCWQLQTVAAAKPKLRDILEEAKKAIPPWETFLYHYSDSESKMYIKITDVLTKDDNSGTITYLTTYFPNNGAADDSMFGSVKVSQTMLKDASVTAPANEYGSDDWAKGVKEALEKLLKNAVTKLASKSKDKKAKD